MSVYLCVCFSIRRVVYLLLFSPSFLVALEASLGSVATENHGRMDTSSYQDNDYDHHDVGDDVYDGIDDDDHAGEGGRGGGGDAAEKHETWQRVGHGTGNSPTTRSHEQTLSQHAVSHRDPTTNVGRAAVVTAAHSENANFFPRGRGRGRGIVGVPCGGSNSAIAGGVVDHSVDWWNHPSASVGANSATVTSASASTVSRWDGARGGGGGGSVGGSAGSDDGLWEYEGEVGFVDDSGACEIKSRSDPACASGWWPGADEDTNDLVDRLVAMGFDRHDSERCLTECDGDIERAATVRVYFFLLFFFVKDLHMLRFSCSRLLQ